MRTARAAGARNVCSGFPPAAGPRLVSAVAIRFCIFDIPAGGDCVKRTSPGSKSWGFAHVSFFVSFLCCGSEAIVDAAK
jgi:hypothetical protein